MCVQICTSGPALVVSLWFCAVYCLHCASTSVTLKNMSILQRSGLYTGELVSNPLRQAFCLQPFAFLACITLYVLLLMHHQSAVFVLFISLPLSAFDVRGALSMYKATVYRDLVCFLKSGQLFVALASKCKSSTLPHPPISHHKDSIYSFSVFRDCGNNLDN